MAKRYINVAYKDRDMAKRLGARWEPSVRRWYCPPGSALAKVYSWRKAGSGAAVSVSSSETLSNPSMSGVVASRTRKSPPSGQLSFLA